MSFLPNELTQAIEEEISKIEFSFFSEAIKELSILYRKNENIFINSLAQRLAYIGVRLPATYAAIKACLLEIKTLFPDSEILSLLDLGSGPGTALWAATTVYPTINKATLVERDKEFSLIGKKLAQKSSNPLISNTNWLNLDLNSDFLNNENISLYDLVTISYALGEIPSEIQKNVLTQAWKATNNFLLVLEPGTVKGFHNIIAARNFLIDLGANIVAPCPHKETCPMLENDWCHFPARVERSSFHRRAKEGTLSYEDEKFSYIIVSKHLVSSYNSRIIRHPLKRPGHIHLDLCTANSLSRITVSQKNKASYKMARKISWGDTWKDN